MENNLQPLEWHNEKRKVKDLVPFEFNPRKLSEEKKQLLINSIEKFNLAEVPAINLDNVIIAGHQRIKVLMELGRGEEEIDVRIPNRLLTEKEYKEYNITSNIPVGFWDVDVLDESFSDINLEELGLFIEDGKVVFEDYDKQEGTIKVLEAEEDDFDTTPPEEPKTVLGDLYEIGEHRLLCGDSTDSDSLEKLLNNNKADLVFTDPPYRMQVEGGSNQSVGQSARKLGEAIKHLCDFDPIGFLNNISLAFNKNIMNAYIFCNKDLVPDYLNWGLENGYSFNILFWKKPNAIPLGGSHRPDVEYLLLFRKSAIWNNGLKDVNYSKCLEFGRDNSEAHPTMKPIELISNEMKISSNENSLVVDFFLGSGSTMVASHQLKRKCYGMELDPKYCDVIVKRMLKLDNTLKVKRNGIDCTNEFII